MEGRQIATGTDEKGLESTGRATNEYFQDKYKGDDTTISLTSEGAIDTSKLGTNVGDYYSHWEEQSANNIIESREAFDKLKNKNYKLGDDEFLKNLKSYSKNSPYIFTIESSYFGFYYLPEEIQKKYFGKIEDKTGNIAEGLNITLRSSNIVSYTEVVVTEQNKKGEKFVTLTRYTRIADEFSKPYDLKKGVPSNLELGNRYGLMSDYEKHNIFPNKLRYVVKNKSPEQIKNEIKKFMTIGKNNEINNLNKIDSWEYKDFLENQKRIEELKGKKK